MQAALHYTSEVLISAEVNVNPVGFLQLLLLFHICVADETILILLIIIISETWFQWAEVKS